MNLITKIEMFFGKQELISALERTIQLLAESEDSDWSSLTANEIKQILELELQKINDGEEFDKVELAVLFTPASNIQETAMWNNWHSEYLRIAEIVDGYTS